MYFSVLTSDAKKRGTKKKKSRNVGALRSESACHGERPAKQTFEKQSCEINEQRKCHTYNKEV